MVQLDLPVPQLHFFWWWLSVGFESIRCWGDASGSTSPIRSTFVFGSCVFANVGLLAVAP